MDILAELEKKSPSLVIKNKRGENIKMNVEAVLEFILSEYIFATDIGVEDAIEEKQIEDRIEKEVKDIVKAEKKSKPKRGKSQAVKSVETDDEDFI